MSAISVVQRLRLAARMLADHKKERQDAPDAELDPANGWCLCGAHHSLKTAREREKKRKSQHARGPKCEGRAAGAAERSGFKSKLP